MIQRYVQFCHLLIIILSYIDRIISNILFNHLILWHNYLGMKPSFEQVNKQPDGSQLRQLILDLPEFEPYWHFHPEFELTYIISGSGKRIIGDSVEPFVAGDLVLLGPDLPHTWNSAPGQKGQYKAVVFQFGRSIVPGPGNGFPEFQNIARLLDFSVRGLHFYGNDMVTVSKKITRLCRLTGLEKTTAFWLLLNELATKGKFVSLASEGYVPSLNKHNADRINKVFGYVSDHFGDMIKLSDVASLVHMTETSFSRFFKQITGEPFTEYLNNARISHACVLLAGRSERSISEIALESGFRSSTHFNRMFLQKKGCTPSYFRQQHDG